MSAPARVVVAQLSARRFAVMLLETHVSGVPVYRVIETHAQLVDAAKAARQWRKPAAAVSAPALDPLAEQQPF